MDDQRLQRANSCIKQPKEGTKINNEKQGLHVEHWIKLKKLILQIDLQDRVYHYSGKGFEFSERHTY